MPDSQQQYVPSTIVNDTTITQLKPAQISMILKHLDLFHKPGLNK